MKLLLKIQDLFVAPIIEPTHKFLVSHIGNTRHIGIFTREVYGFVKTLCHSLESVKKHFLH